MRRYVVLYAVALTIPLFFALTIWQSNRYAALKQEIKRLEEAQADWVESNKRLIAGIAVLSSPERIEHIAQNELELSKIKPEDVLQIRIEGEGRDF
ncbi:MAG: septum formation initiator family protein [Treponema sp.]|jgi:cell division protein FtsL|nr:septum formation initiator family protein [Treponema sp.]